MLRPTLLTVMLATCVMGATLPMRRIPHTGRARGWAVTKGRIFGGHQATKGQFPYIASLQLVLDGDRFHNCAGSVVTATAILTAAHCVWSSAYYYAVVGEYDMGADEGTEQEVLVTEQIPHPLFNGAAGVGPYDVAVFKLQSALTLNANVQTISLPTAGSIPEGGSIAVLSGWGYTENGTQPDILQTVDLTVYDYDVCKEHMDGLDPNFNPLTETMVCTGPFYEGIAMCAGDSGGPLEQNQQLIGIASFTMNPCGAPGAPSIFTRVSAYLDFINENL